MEISPNSADRRPTCISVSLMLCMTRAVLMPETAALSPESAAAAWTSSPAWGASPGSFAAASDALVPAGAACCVAGDSAVAMEADASMGLVAEAVGDVASVWACWPVEAVVAAGAVAASADEDFVVAADG